jgi:hypothetical protein
MRLVARSGRSRATKGCPYRRRRTYTKVRPYEMQCSLQPCLILSPLSQGAKTGAGPFFGPAKKGHMVLAFQEKMNLDPGKRACPGPRIKSGASFDPGARVTKRSAVGATSEFATKVPPADEGGHRGPPLQNAMHPRSRAKRRSGICRGLSWRAGEVSARRTLERVRRAEDRP